MAWTAASIFRSTRERASASVHWPLSRSRIKAACVTRIASRRFSLWHRTFSANRTGLRTGLIREGGGRQTHTPTQHRAEGGDLRWERRVPDACDVLHLSKGTNDRQLETTPRRQDCVARREGVQPPRAPPRSARWTRARRRSGAPPWSPATSQASAVSNPLSDHGSLANCHTLRPTRG